MKNDFNKNMKHQQIASQTQGGMAMIIVIVALLVLTLLGLSAADSGSLQSVMVRNNQLRLEAFNASLAEIEAQLDSYEQTDTGKAFLVDVVQGAVIDETDLGLLSNNPAFEKNLTLSSKGGCPNYYNSLGGPIKCNLIELDSISEYQESNVGSDQVQQFTFYSL